MHEKCVYAWCVVDLCVYHVYACYVVDLCMVWILALHQPDLVARDWWLHLWSSLLSGPFSATP